MSLVGMAINLSLDVTLIWPMGGGGLALATAVSSIVQCGLVLWLFELRVGRLDWRTLAAVLSAQLRRHVRDDDRVSARRDAIPAGP